VEEVLTRTTNSIFLLFMDVVLLGSWMLLLMCGYCVVCDKVSSLSSINNENHYCDQIYFGRMYV